MSTRRSLRWTDMDLQRIQPLWTSPWIKQLPSCDPHSPPPPKDSGIMHRAAHGWRWAGLSEWLHRVSIWIKEIRRCSYKTQSVIEFACGPVSCSLFCSVRGNIMRLCKKTTGPVFSFHVSFEQFIPLTPEGKQRYKGHRGVQHLLCADEGMADVSHISQHGGRAVNTSALPWIKLEAGLCSSQSSLNVVPYYSWVPALSGLVFSWSGAHRKNQSVPMLWLLAASFIPSATTPTSCGAHKLALIWWNTHQSHTDSRKTHTKKIDGQRFQVAPQFRGFGLFL